MYNNLLKEYKFYRGEFFEFEDPGTKRVLTWYRNDTDGSKILFYFSFILEK
jgi:hypothetical protein